MSDNWKWRMGILNGIGHAVWEQSESKFRRVTMMAAGQQGLVMIKSPLWIVMGDEAEVEWDPDSMVVVGTNVPEKLIQDVMRIWGARIIPANGLGLRKIEGLK